MYFLEAIVPFLALILIQDQLEPYITILVDDQAALTALQKGYGKDNQINNLIGVIWTLVVDSLYTLIGFLPTSMCLIVFPGKVTLMQLTVNGIE